VSLKHIACTLPWPTIHLYTTFEPNLHKIHKGRSLGENWIWSVHAHLAHLLNGDERNIKQYIIHFNYHGYFICYIFLTTALLRDCFHSSCKNSCAFEYLLLLKLHRYADMERERERERERDVRESERERVCNNIPCTRIEICYSHKGNTERSTVSFLHFISDRCWLCLSKFLKSFPYISDIAVLTVCYINNIFKLAVHFIIQSYLFPIPFLVVFPSPSTRHTTQR